MSRRSTGKGTSLGHVRIPNHESGDIVIVGNGIAGLTAAIEARRLAPDKHIVIITTQSHPTIHTPALKQFATGKLAREQLLAYPAGTERTQRIHIIQAHVEEIHANGKYVCLSDGRAFGYSSLLLATGSAPIGLPAHVPGRDFDGVLTLHGLRDYLDLRRRLREVKQVVVIGGGTHALDTVMALLHLGLRVHWLIRSATFLPRTLDLAASNVVLERSRQAGANVYTETEVVGIVGRVGAVMGVVTNQDQMLPCQMVLACTGTAPVTTLAQHCDVPLKLGQGILVDDHLHTSVPGIYAAGDVAALQNPQTGAYHSRAQWQAAVVQGLVAATVMTGYDELASPFGVCWHATSLGRLALLAVGDPLDSTEGAAILTDGRKRDYRRLCICDDRLIGYLSVGTTQPDSLAMKRIIDEGLSIRGHEKALLTGEFDARQYFSQQRSQTLSTLVTTGRLTVTHPPAPVSLTAQRSHDTEPLLLTPVIARKQNRRDDAVAHQTGPGKEQHTSERATAQAPAIRSFKSLMSKHFESAGWIVPTILPVGLVALVGKRKVGKSWLDLAFGLGISDGSSVLGNIQVKQGDVLYLALEDNERRLQERLEKLVAPGASIPDGFEYAATWPRMGAGGIAALKAWLDSHPQARLIIIDTWDKIQPLTEQENNASEYTDKEALIRLKLLADAYHVCILVQLHSSQSAAHTPTDELQTTTDVAQWADGVLSLRRTPGKATTRLSGTGRAYVHHLDLALTFNDGRWEASGNTATSTLSPARRAIITVLNASEKPMKAKEIAIASGKQDGAIRKILHDMKAGGLLQETVEGYSSLVPEVAEARPARSRGNAEKAGNARTTKKNNELATELSLTPSA